MNTTNGTAPTDGQTDATTTMQDLVALLMSGGDAGSSSNTPPSQAAQPSTFAPAVTRTPRTAPEIVDMDTLRSEVNRLAADQVGLVRTLKFKLFGDDLKRQQFQTIAKRIDAINITQEAKLALLVICATRLVAYRAVGDCIDEMDAIHESYPPDGYAKRTSDRMREQNASHLATLANQLLQKSEIKVARALDLQ